MALSARRSSDEVRDLAGFRRWAAAALPQGLAFLGPDPHHALGFLDLAPRLLIAAADRPPALDAAEALGAQTWTPSGRQGPQDEADSPGATARMASTAASRPPGPSDASPVLDGSTAGQPVEEREVGRDSASLAADPGFLAWLAAFGAEDGLPPVAVFKPSHRLEELARAGGWRLLSAPAGLARQWENKVAFRAKAAALGLRQPAGLVLGPGDGFEAAAAQLGLPFVLQAPHGYSGAKTLRVVDEESFMAAREGLRAPRLRATAWAAGTSLTLNACVTARGVAMGAPCLQVTGEPGLTRHRLGSCGNDWSWSGLAGLDLAAYRRVTQTVGEALGQEGFRGYFGLDFIQDPSGSEPWLIEVNPRLVASASLHAQLELLAGRLPLAARHLMAHLDPAADTLPLDAHEAALEGGQLILHNLDRRGRVWEGDLAAGPLAADGQATIRGAATPSAVDPSPACLLRQLSDTQALLLPPPVGREIASGAEWGRVQARAAVTDDNGHPLASLTQSLAALCEAAAWPAQRVDSDDEPTDQDFV